MQVRKEKKGASIRPRPIRVYTSLTFVLALYSVFYFIGIYFTLVEGYPSGKAGIQLLFYIPGIGGNNSLSLPPKANFLIFTLLTRDF